MITKVNQSLTGISQADTLFCYNVFSFIISDYKFVPDDFKITDEMRKDYNDDGFILVR